MVLTDLAYQGPKRGADRAVLLAHGAGADMNAATLTTVADALADAKVPSLRFNFPYRAAGRRAPDRPAVLERAVQEAVDELARRTKLPPERLVLGGRSMGGRICSMVAADAVGDRGVLGLVLLGYPLHPPGRPAERRDKHLPAIARPMLFVQGARDAFGTPDELGAALAPLNPAPLLYVVERGDHSFKLSRKDPPAQAAIYADVQRAIVTFVSSVP
jgi:hypothetical protein